MKTNNNKKIIGRYIDEVENTGDVSNIHEFIDEKYAEAYEGERYEIGIKGAIDHIPGVRRVFPDLKLTIENQISEDDWVGWCCHGNAIGTEGSGLWGEVGNFQVLLNQDGWYNRPGSSSF